MTDDKIGCPSCDHRIDQTAKICPYCGVNLKTGERFDPAPVLASHFPPKGAPGRKEKLLDLLRHNQSLVIVGVIFAILVIGAATHELVSRSNAEQATDVPAIPLTEIADLSDQQEEQEELPLPELEVHHEGNAHALETLLVEPEGANPTPSP